MKNSAFGSLTSTLTYKTGKTSETQWRWFQICLTGAVVTVQLHRPREANGLEMRACGINYGGVMSLIWSVLSRTMTQQSQKEDKRGSSFLAWVWKSVLCQNPHTGLERQTGFKEVGSDASNQESFVSVAIVLPVKGGWQPWHKIQFIPNHSGLIMLMQTEWWLGWGRGIIPEEDQSRFHNWPWRQNHSSSALCYLSLFFAPCY